MLSSKYKVYNNVKFTKELFRYINYIKYIMQPSVAEVTEGFVINIQ